MQTEIYYSKNKVITIEKPRFWTNQFTAREFEASSPAKPEWEHQWTRRQNAANTQKLRDLLKAQGFSQVLDLE